MTASMAPCSVDVGTWDVYLVTRNMGVMDQRACLGGHIYHYHQSDAFLDQVLARFSLLYALSVVAVTSR